MRSLQDAVDRHLGVSEDTEASYPHLLAALESLNAEIAAARLREVESAMCDIWRTMNDLGIALKQLADYRRSRSPARANETSYRNPQTEALWNGKGRPSEWLRGKAWGQFQVGSLLNTDAEFTHEAKR
jgi:DNA-binding protein H-NS